MEGRTPSPGVEHCFLPRLGGWSGGRAAEPTRLSCRGGTGAIPVLPWSSQATPSTNHPPSAALKSSPSKKGRGALLAVKPLGPTAAFSASQIPSEREDAQYDLRGARSYPTLEDEGEQVAGSGCIFDGR